MGCTACPIFVCFELYIFLFHFWVESYLKAILRKMSTEAVYPRSCQPKVRHPALGARRRRTGANYSRIPSRTPPPFLRQSRHRIWYPYWSSMLRLPFTNRNSYPLRPRFFVAGYQRNAGKQNQVEKRQKNVVRKFCVVQMFKISMPRSEARWRRPPEACSRQSARYYQLILLHRSD